MKPTRNRYFCHACKRTKMLFGTEEEALKFIEFNKEEIEECSGKVPVRSYHCNLCGGWHVTSNPNADFFEDYKSESEIELESFLNQKKIQCVQKAIKKNENINHHVFCIKDLVSKHDYLNAAKESIRLYNYFNKTEKKSDQGQDIIKQAFEYELLFISQISQKGGYDAGIYSAIEVLNSLILAVDKQRPSFENKIRRIRELINQSVQESTKHASESGLHVVIDEVDKEVVKQNLARQKQILSKRPEVAALELTISKIYPNIVSNQRMEAKRWIRKAIKDIQEIQIMEDDKELISSCLNTLIEYRNLFIEKFPDYPLE